MVIGFSGAGGAPLIARLAQAGLSGGGARSREPVRCMTPPTGWRSERCSGNERLWWAAIRWPLA
jgi:hypothetical protein